MSKGREIPGVGGFFCQSGVHYFRQRGTASGYSYRVDFKWKLVLVCIIFCAPGENIYPSNSKICGHQTCWGLTCVMFNGMFESTSRHFLYLSQLLLFKIYEQNLEKEVSHWISKEDIHTTWSNSLHHYSHSMYFQYDFYNDNAGLHASHLQLVFSH